MIILVEIEGGNKMASCETMKKGQVYVCEDCGFEVEVIKECNCHEDPNCPHDVHEDCCDFQCCGKPLALKK
ncbi:hypothetical protein EGX98_11335 [Fusobacterium necrophorum]|nr:hypothetical protein [Fusobacterium necrophorum]KDE63703.1 hypothetical protein FUSO3_04705 [Fusobacterium necrophorum BL]KDE67070.1 hypothetical protein FUSO5_01055 [Fusobacterium necrophorum BFTR-1]KDE68187.1 hypothetical protein FUSO4_01155 [Fusobacterium necrophorum DJ-1]KDE70546.1 hypothetical protein FUSO6_03835 [Fusobacterium necrophorum DAB]KDE72303.1 hypothetical protein FUSO8_05645 [Fusobacterium necrophorum DJ-2]KDE74697.1 hypothetical protein FUSO7_01490 [Fusobacterium necropho